MTPFSTFAEVIGAGALLVSLSTFWVMLVTRRQTRWKETRAEWETRYHGIQQQHEVVNNWLVALDKDMGIIKTQMAVFWKGLSVSSAAALHSPHTPVLDALIEGFQAGTLTADELLTFRQHLCAIVLDAAETPQRQWHARMTLTAMDLLYTLGDELSTLPPGAYPPTALHGDLAQLARNAAQVLPPPEA